MTAVDLSVEVEVKERMKSLWEKTATDHTLLLSLLNQLGYVTSQPSFKFMVYELERMAGAYFKLKCLALAQELEERHRRLVETECWTLDGGNKIPAFLHTYVKEVAQEVDEARGKK